MGIQSLGGARARQARRPSRLAAALAVAAVAAVGCSDPEADPPTVVATGPSEAPPAPAPKASDEPHTYDDEPEVAESAAATLQTAAQDDALETVMTDGARETFGDPADALPDGSTVEVDPTTWLRRGPLAVVTVTVTVDATADTFDAVLIDTGDGWKLSHTEPTGADR